MAINSSTGLVSGLNISDIVTSLVTSQKNAVTRLQARGQTFQNTQVGLNTLSAKLLTLTTSSVSLGLAANFQTFAANSSDTNTLTAKAGTAAVAGTYQFQALRLASAQQVLSRGYTDATQTVGAGTLTVAAGGGLASETTLSALNGGAGVRRGVIRITDRSGATADVDLTGAASVNDVVKAINSTSGINVSASVDGDKLVLADATGQSASNLIVVDKAGGNAAADLGIRQSVASATLTGSSVYQVGGNFSLSKLNDGNGLRQTTGQPDLRIVLTDVAATTLDVNLDGANTLNDVVSKINSATGNDGKLTAAVTNGKLVLTDTTGGGGAANLAVSNLNGSNAARTLGLDAAATGGTLTGNRLGAGINSVLLKNLRGGAGISQTGQISLTDRAGTTAVVNLTGADSLDQVLTAINNATDGVTKLKLQATINSAGTGITIQDSSGQTASNLVIADVGGSTLATQLGISVNAAQTSIKSGSLNLRYVNEATSLSTYGTGATDIRRGSIGIKDSTGIEYFVNINSDVKTIGDVIDKINTATGNKVTASLNETGDGFVLKDQAGGGGQIVVRDLDNKTAADLKLAGTGTTGLDGKSQLSSRAATIITIASTDTLSGITDKLNAAKVGIAASVVNDGTAFSPNRLSLTSNIGGAAGRFLVDDGGLDLGFAINSAGQDALLRVGSDASTGFVISSGTNTFDKLSSGLTITLKAASATPTTVTVSQDISRVTASIQSFVNNYNGTITQIADATKFDTTSKASGPLRGEGVTLRVKTALGNLVTGTRFGTSGNDVKSLAGIGVSISSTGQLSFDTDKFAAAATKNPQAIADFFAQAETGFAKKLKSTIESFTDEQTGQLTAASNAAQASITTLEKRITDLNTLLDSKTQRLLTQFYQLETILGKLQSQQSALNKLDASKSSSSN